MKEYIEIKNELEGKGFHGISLIAGGLLIACMNCSGEICIFNLKMEQLDIENIGEIKQDPNNKNIVKIKISNYETEYEIID